MDYSRINKLKKLPYIYPKDNVTTHDLLLKDEDGHTYLEYIVNNKISIEDDNLIDFLSNNYDYLKYLTDNNYFLNHYANSDLLFNEINGERLIIKIYKANIFYRLSLDIIYKFFQKIDDHYIISDIINAKEKLLNLTSLIPEVNNYNLLLKCFDDIKRDGLFKYANTNILLQQYTEEYTLLEILLRNNIIPTRMDKTSEFYAELLYKYGKYDELITLDTSVLVNYPSKEHNYLQLLIEKNYNFDNKSFNYSLLSYDKKDYASALLFLAPKYNLQKVGANTLTSYSEVSNQMPLIFHMLEQDFNVTKEYFINDEVMEGIIDFLSEYRGINKEDLKDFKLEDYRKYLPQVDNLKEKLKNNEVKELTKEDFFHHQLLEKYDDNMTILEYCLKNSIEISDYNDCNFNEILIMQKYHKLPSIQEKYLFQKVDEENCLIDLLIKNNEFSDVRSAIGSNLKILDYCRKYHNYKIIGDKIKDELFVIINGSCLAEEFLNDENFIKEVYRYEISKEQLELLFNKGYLKFLSYAREKDLLIEINGKTVLEHLLDNNIDPNFQYFYADEEETVKILMGKKAYHLMHNVNIGLLVDKPNKENNYLQQLIELYKQGNDIKFEFFNTYSENLAAVAKLYIQMNKNGLGGFLDTLDAKKILKEVDSDYNSINDLSNDQNEVNNEQQISKDPQIRRTLLYYLIQEDKDYTLNKLLNINDKKNLKVDMELRLMGITEGVFDFDYDRLDFDEIYRKTYIKDFASTIKSPVDDLLQELTDLFKQDQKSDMSLVESLVISYRYYTSINPLFIEELKKLIEAKKNNPDFYYLKEKNAGCFNTGDKSVHVKDATISTLIHETGHALHFFTANNAVPKELKDVIKRIVTNPDFNSKVDAYSKQYSEIKNKVTENAQGIIDKYPHKDDDSQSKEIVELMKTKKEEISKIYLEKGYSQETISQIISTQFTAEEFVEQKKEIEKYELVDAIMRYEYDAFIAIGDIIDGVVGGKFKSNIYYNDKGETIQNAYGHGIRYYSRDDFESVFLEMIANYSSMMKSKKSSENIALLRYIVGDELVDLIDNFYKYSMLKKPIENDIGGNYGSIRL